MNYDIDRLLELLGPEAQDDPEIQAIMWGYQTNKKFAANVGRLLYGLVLKRGGDPDNPGAFPIVRELPPGMIALGPVDNGRLDGPTFCFPEPDPSNLRHIGIFGETRFGKTSVLMHICLQRMLSGHIVWMFDLEDEFARLIPALPEAARPIPLTPAHLLINFFEPPGDWVELKSWLWIIGLLLRGQTFIRDGSENLFIDTLLELFKTKGVFAGGSEFPSLAETLNYFQSLKLSGSSKRGKEWVETLINRLKMLVNAFGSTSRVTHSNTLQLLGQRSVIFRLRGCSGVPLRFLVNFLLIWLSCYKEGVIDENPHSSH